MSKNPNRIPVIRPTSLECPQKAIALHDLFNSVLADLLRQRFADMQKRDYSVFSGEIFRRLKAPVPILFWAPLMVPGAVATNPADEEEYYKLSQALKNRGALADAAETYNCAVRIRRDFDGALSLFFPVSPDHPNRQRLRSDHHII